MNQENYILELAEKIIPASWKICQNLEDMDFNNPLILNINLIINEKDNKYLGYTSGAVESGHCPLIIYQNKDFSIEATLLHELSHIAVKRWVAWKKQQLYEDMHGPTFQRAYKTMLSRAWKYINEGVINEIEIEIEYYKYTKGVSHLKGDNCSKTAS